jgi:L-alanine-DL-glutamate epimerase-like enolase superfamily enzyme
MKITRLVRKVVKVPLAKPIPSAQTLIRSIDCVLVFLETDEGLVGEGLVFTLNGHRLPLLNGLIASLEPLVIGMDPTDSGRFWLQAWADIAFLGRRGASIMGVAAIDMALWDLRGKAAGLNVSRLIGRCRDSVPIYRSNGLRLSASIEELQTEAAGFVSQGFQAMKMSLGSAKARQDVARVRAVREVIGPDVKLMTDCNQQFSPMQAIQLGRQLEEFDLAWIEEPVSAFSHTGEAQVAAALTTPVASGENEYTRLGMMDMLRQGSADILMPDMQRMGGPTELLKVAHMAEGFDIPITPHLFSEMSLPLAGAISNVNYAEYVVWFEELYGSTITLDCLGNAKIPELPGWGVSFDPAAVERFTLRP